MRHDKADVQLYFVGASPVFMKKCEGNPGMQVSTTFWEALNAKIHVKFSRQ